MVLYSMCSIKGDEYVYYQYRYIENLQNQEKSSYKGLYPSKNIPSKVIMNMLYLHKSIQLYLLQSL